MTRPTAPAKQAYTFLDAHTMMAKSARAATEKEAAGICARRSYGRRAVVIAIGSGWRIDTPESANINSLIGAAQSKKILSQHR